MSEAIATLQNRLKAHRNSVIEQQEKLTKANTERDTLMADIERSQRVKKELEAGIIALGGTVE
jgi:peptidoglycan hydrolase CwlO-like protein